MMKFEEEKYFWIALRNLFRNTHVWKCAVPLHYRQFNCNPSIQLQNKLCGTSNQKKSNLLNWLRKIICFLHNDSLIDVVSIYYQIMFDLMLLALKVDHQASCWILSKKSKTRPVKGLKWVWAPTTPLDFNWVICAVIY